MKLGNVSNAILLCFVGVWAILTAGGDDAILVVLAALYVMYVQFCFFDTLIIWAISEPSV